MSMEWGGANRRGFMASLPQLGVPIGLLLSTLAVRIVLAITGPAAFDGWRWRIPFLISVVLVAIGFYVRISVLETPQFARLRKEQTVVKRPVWEVFRTQPRAIATSAFIRLAEQAPFYLFITFVLAYGTEQLGLQRDDLLNDTLIAAAVLATTHSSTGISLYIVGCAVISMIALLLMPKPHVSAHDDAEELERELAR